MIYLEKLLAFSCYHKIENNKLTNCIGGKNENSYVDSPNVILIQKAVHAALIIGKHPKNLHSRIISYYWDNYQCVGNFVYLNFAIEHIAAYVKANFDYSEKVPLFSEIVKEAEYSSFEDFLSYVHAAKRMKRVKLTCNRIAAILGDGAFLQGNRRTVIENILQKSPTARLAYTPIPRHIPYCFPDHK